MWLLQWLILSSAPLLLDDEEDAVVAVIPQEVREVPRLLDKEDEADLTTEVRAVVPLFWLSG